MDNKTKKLKKKFDEKFNKSLDELKKNIANQEKFNQIISGVIADMDIEDKEIFEDTEEK